MELKFTKTLIEFEKKLDEKLSKDQPLDSSALFERAVDVSIIFNTSCSQAIDTLNQDILCGLYYNSAFINKTSEECLKPVQLLKNIFSKYKMAVVNPSIEVTARESLSNARNSLQSLDHRFALFLDLAKYVQRDPQRDSLPEFDSDEQSKIYNIRNAISKLHTPINEEANISPLTDIIFRLNIRAALLDHEINSSKKYLKECNEFLKICKQHILSRFDLIELLTEKVGFLINKASYRRDSRRTDIGFSNAKFSPYEFKYYTSFNSKFQQVYGLIETKPTPIEELREFRDCIQKLISNRNVQTLDSIKFDIVYKFLKIFSNRIPKPQESDIQLLHSLDNFIQSLIQSLSFHIHEHTFGKFDLIALNSLCLRVSRTCFKIECRLFTESLENSALEKVITSLLKLRINLEKRKNFEQITLQNKDYYLYELYLDSYINFLRKIDHNPTINIGLKELSELNHFAFSLFPKVLYGIHWMKETPSSLTKYYPFTNCISYVESTRNGKFSNLQLFLDSNYIAPIDLESAEIKLSETKEEFTKFRTSITAKILLSMSEQTERNVQEVIHQSHLKGTELLSLFAAAIAFVVTAITAIPKFDNLMLVILFLWGLAGALFIFVLGINLVVGIKHNFKSIVVFSIGFLVTGVILFTTLSKFPNLEFQIKKEQRTNAPDDVNAVESFVPPSSQNPESLRHAHESRDTISKFEVKHQ